MTLVALCSLKGSPGVTTAALGMAARWPSGEHPVVVECDPAGGDLLARFRLETSPGLVSLAAAARRGAEPGLVWQHTQRLPGGLPVVAGPARPEQACAALAQITGAGAAMLRRAAARPGTVVVADCGRVGPGSPALEILRAADVMLLLARSHDDALSHVAADLDIAVRWSRHPCFVLVGDGYPTSEVAQTLGIEVMGRVPEDRNGAAALGGRPGRRTAPAQSPLGRALARIAASAASRAFTPPGWEQKRAVDSPGSAFNSPPTVGQSTLQESWERATR
ncbi:MinD/ParA family protein [Streptomyces sp. NPDC058256]|uniref:MinD/ParA family ATP-binding protein n=1 Tax=Streptomyces sp. NPDC058256 TaxID=3346408 RepID=UPI0036E94D0C